MTRPAADRVRVEWTGTGTGTMTLGSVVSGFQGFPASLNGMIVSYAIEHQTSSEAEAGFGTYTSGANTLSRTYRTYPTLGGSSVSFSAGSKHVRLTATQVDLAPNLATTAPTTGDDISVGYLEGRSRWLNTTTNLVYICADHTAGAAVWTQVGGSGGGGSSVATGITVSFDPTNYIESDSSVEGHLVGINNALTGGADAQPNQATSNAAEYVLLVGNALHTNAEVLSHQANVDFEVPTSASPGYKWLIKPLHDGCIVSVDTNVGSVNGVAGGSARLINGGLAVVEVNALSGGPIVTVRGNVIVPPVDVGGTKTYDNDDCDGEFRLTSTSTQTISASANYQSGFDVILIRETAGTILIDGVDADYTISGPDVVNIIKAGTAMLAMGKAGIIVLDAA